MERDFDKLNEKILEKLENKIAVAEFEEKETVQKKSKVKSFIGLKVASIIAVVGLVSGNAYTFATYNKDLFSVILERVGIFEEYNEERTEVNITKEDEKSSLTLVDYAIDGDTLIVGYNLKLKEENEMLVKMVHDSVTLKCGDEKICLTDETDDFGMESYKDFALFEEISKTEYSIYRFYTINPEKLTNQMTLDVNVKIYDYDKEEYYNPTHGEPEMREVGTWDFSVELNKAELEESFKEYYVENNHADFKFVEGANTENTGLASVSLLSIKKSDILTRFKFRLQGYYTDVVYFVEIVDENGKVILEKDVQYLVGGVDTEIITKKLDDNAKITINVYEMEPGIGLEIYTPSDTIYSKATLEIDMANELMSEKKTEGIKRTWKEIEFEYGEYASENEFVHEEINGNSERSTMYINLYEMEINNAFDWSYDNQISIFRYTNDNKECLETIVEELQLLETAGGYYYKPTETYTVYLKDPSKMPDGLRAQDATFEQILELGKGNDIIVQGATINQNDVDINETKFVNQEEIEIDGVKAITWVQEYSDIKYGKDLSDYSVNSTGKMQRKYVFLVDRYIYEITCPEGVENQEEVNEIIDSLKIK